jgi:hypothetical protein
MFTDLANPFGANAYDPTAIQKPAQTLYYKGLRLAQDTRPHPARPEAPVAHRP